MSVLSSIALLAIIVESITYICISADLLDKPRTALKESCRFLEGLLSCGYCFSFWVALILLVIYSSSSSIILIDGVTSWINFIFCWLLLHRLSNVVHGAIDKYFDRQKDLRYRSIFTEE